MKIHLISATQPSAQSMLQEHSSYHQGNSPKFMVSQKDFILIICYICIQILEMLFNFYLSTEVCIHVCMCILCMYVYVLVGVLMIFAWTMLALWATFLSTWLRPALPRGEWVEVSDTHCVLDPFPSSIYVACAMTFNGRHSNG